MGLDQSNISLSYLADGWPGATPLRPLNAVLRGEAIHEFNQVAHFRNAHARRAGAQGNETAVDPRHDFLPLESRREYVLPFLRGELIPVPIYLLGNVR